VIPSRRNFLSALPVLLPIPKRKRKVTPEYPVVSNTGLLVPAVNSPNFNLQNPAASPTPSWAILQNGLAYFFGLTLFGGTITGPDYIINTSGIFIYNGTPAAGNLIGSWAGATGTDAFGNAYPQGLNVTEGAVSGTTFTGTDFVINSTGAFFYQGTPGANTMTAAIIPNYLTSTQDPYGNWAIGGIGTYGTNADGGDYVASVFQAGSVAGNQTYYTAATMQGATSPWVNQGGVTWDPVLGYTVSVFLPVQLQAQGTGRGASLLVGAEVTAVDGLDGQTYDTERKTLNSHNLSGAITSATPVNIGPFTWPVAARTYQVSGMFIVNCTTAGTPEIEFSAPGAAAGQMGIVTSRAGILIAAQLAPNTLGGMGALTAGDTYLVNFDGILVPAASGNLTINMAASGGVGSFTVAAYSYANILPV
jgi:hypothetical protein